jgi:ABC-type dipeptide/oligopeptide/nickel transport system permease subunit
LSRLIYGAHVSLSVGLIAVSIYETIAVTLEQMPWLWAPPGIAIMLAVLCINFVGDGRRDASDPKGLLASKA